MTRRGLLTLAAIGAVLSTLVLASVAAVGYWVFTGTPTYSLWQTKRAMERHDLGTFRKYVDVRGVSRALVDSLLAESQKEQRATRSTSNQ
jgi:hypothetical protein